MIRYALKCAADHSFDSWFQSSEAFDSLAGKGRVACPVCGSVAVAKALMAPAVRETPAVVPPGKGALAAPASEIEEALAALRREVEANSEYVGVEFATEARRIHSGAAPDRAIYGEARLDEARKLIEDGVPVAPLPFMPARKVN